MRWKRIYILFLSSIFLLNTHTANAQSSFGVTANSSWYFDCNSPSCLENGISLSNAVTLRVKCTNKAGYVYARQSVTTYPSGWSSGGAPGGGSLELDLTSTTSTNATNVQANAVTITGSDVLLFVQPKMTKSNSAKLFTYNLNLKPTGYTYLIPGNYGFTMTYTMTQQ